MSEDTLKTDKKQQKIEQVTRQFAQKCADMDIESNVALTAKQITLLKQIHVLAINRALSVPEVMRDPRKIVYYANNELKLGLVAILMTHVLINHLSKAKYTEDFFLEHLMVYTNREGTVKHIDLTDIEDKVLQSALYDEIVYDWIIYRSPGSRGIRALSDEKTESLGIEGFSRGLSPISEFSRFERKYFETKQKKTKEDRESAQRAFRNTFVQQVAQEAAKQLLKTQDPMSLAKLLFATKDYESEIKNLLGDMPISKEIEDLSREFSDFEMIDDRSNNKRLNQQSKKQKNDIDRFLSSSDQIESSPVKAIEFVSQRKKSSKSR